MRHHKAARRRVNMRLSQLIWEWRNRLYLFSGSGLAVATLAFILNGGSKGL